MIGKHRLHFIHGLDYIGRRGLEDDHQNRRLPVEEAASVDVLYAIDNAGDIADPHNPMALAPARRSVMNSPAWL